MPRYVHRLTAGLAFVVVGIVLSFLLAPYILNAWLLPAVLKDLPVSERSLSIGGFTPFSASGALHLGEAEQPVIAVPRFTVRFSPLEVVAKRGRSLTLDHAALHLYRFEDRYILPGLSPTRDQLGTPAQIAPLALPLAVDRLILKNCSLVLHDKDQLPLRLTVTADLTVTSELDGVDAYRLQAVQGTFLLSDGLPARGTLSIAADEDGYSLSLKVAEGVAEVPARFLPPGLQGLHLGPFTAAVALSVSSDLRSLTHLDLQAVFSELSLSAGSLKISGAEDAGTVRLSISGPPSSLGYQLSPLTFSSPILTLQTAPRGSLTVSHNGLELAGNHDVQATLIADRFPLALSYRGLLERGGDWQLGFDGLARLEKPVPIPGSTSTLTMPTATVHAELASRSRQLTGTVELEMPLLDLSLETTAVRVSGTQAQLHLEHRDDRTAGNLQAAITQVVLPGHNAQLNSLELTIPFAQPTPEGADNTAAGSITIGSLGRQDTPLASFAATIHQLRDQFNLAGTLRAVFPPHPEIRLSGSVLPAARQFSASWQLPPTIIDSKLLPTVSGIPAPLGFTGTLAARGNLQRSEGRVGGSLTVDLHNGSLSHEAQHLSVSAIDCSLKFPRLPDIISAPSQRCTAGRIDIGALRFEDAEITYRLEDSRTVFVEKSRVNWCRGTLESGSIRLSADNPDIDTILYSSRINFADLLNQFGFDQTEGEGALNGKLPISWSGKRLLIDDGFLFSTPGAGGIVRFTNTDLLRQGIGAVQQAGSLGYSLKALEDFAYNWSRLSFNSSGDELLMTMELDGRPRSPLPYAFKDGILVEAGQGNLQYPIRLDINLRLPLAELLRVGHNVKSMMGN